VFKRIAAIQVLANGAFLASFTYIAIYANEYGLSRFQISLMASLYSMATFISAYVFGRLADNYGKRKVLLIGLFSLIFFTAAQAFAKDIFSFLSFRFFAGIGFGMFPAALAAYAFEAKAKMGRFSASGAMGWGLALLLSGVVAERFGVWSVFIFGAGLVALSLIIALRLAPIPEVRIRTPVLPIRMIRKNYKVLVPFIIRHTTASAIWVLWPIFLHEKIGLSFWEIGIVQATNALTQFTFMFLIGDKLKPTTLIAVGLSTSALAFISFTLIQTFPLFLLTQVLLGFSWANLFVGSLRMMLDRNKERATAAGLLNSSISLSSLMGPMIALLIVQLLPDSSFEGPMYLAFAASLTAFIFFLSRIKGLRTSPDE
jgi:DHA1 family quinolone resistance protein-like MFS transporter